MKLTWKSLQVCTTVFFSLLICYFYNSRMCLWKMNHLKYLNDKSLIYSCFRYYLSIKLNLACASSFAALHWNDLLSGYMSSWSKLGRMKAFDAVSSKSSSTVFFFRVCYVKPTIWTRIFYYQHVYHSKTLKKLTVISKYCSSGEFMG